LNDAGVIGHPLILGDRTTTVPGADGDLVAAAQAGDRAAFGLLYERYGPMVHGVLLARVRWEDAEDLVQDVFVVAMQRLPSLRTPAAFGSWLAAIARNRATDLHRRERQGDPVEVADLPAPKEEPAEALAILAIIRSLPEAYRETLTLRLVEGMTGPEIAERTGMTAGSVRVNLHRGMKQLKERLAPRSVSGSVRQPELPGRPPGRGGR
jgi:RNA polymerase sigma-70 factor (ECF subfamily)